MPRPAALLTAVAAALAPAALAHAAVGDRLDRSRLEPVRTLTFGAGPLSASATGRGTTFKSRYWYGWQEGDNWTSRMAAGDPFIAAGPDYNGVTPWTVRDGALELRILPIDRRDPRNHGARYGCAVLTTEASFSQTYGLFEIRATLPAGRPGLWPAWWFLAKGDVRGPARAQQEIDGFEGQSVDPGGVLATSHGIAGQIDSSRIAVPGGVGRPHLYSLLWTPDALVWYVDEVEVKRGPNPGLHSPMYTIVSMGPGGWGANRRYSDADIFSGVFRIEALRAWRLK